uniref:Ig-like domain-containing protein n=1 Tax=Labrus bergylta TaxID=56723 RepID=A0A3Q3GI96_9LABR
GPPKITENPEIIKVTVGDPISMDCKVTGSPELKVKWMKDGKELQSIRQHKLTFENNMSSLKIQSVQSDAGSYSCKLTNAAGSCESSGSLMVKEPPSFVTVPESQAAVPNATVRFKGTFKGTPPFTIKWFKNDTELMTGPTCFTGLDGQSCFLELFSVGVTQSGVYSCQVSNDAGSVRCSADLTVKALQHFHCYLKTSILLLTDHCQLIPAYLITSCPAFHNHLSEVPCTLTRANIPVFWLSEPPEFVLKLPATKFVRQGESLRLECKVSGTTPLTVTWYKHETRVTDGGNYKTSFVDSVAVLELHSSSFDDDGVYTCEAQNDAGSVSCSTTLSVKEPPCFVKVPQPIEGLKGKDVSLYCEMSGTAPFQITWFKDRKPLMESRKYKMVSEGSSATLHVIGIEPTDAGEYECKVSNSVGSETCQTSVKLREPPSFVKKLSNMTVILGEEVTLVATVKGSEPITVSWVQDKDHILRDGDNRKITFENNKVALKVFKADATTAGKYTCQLRNDAGSVECFANLTVLGL